jgi:hypothetical protein
MRTLESNKQGLEAKNQVIDVVKRLREQWEDRFTLNNPRLMENYVKAKVHFLILIKDALKPENQFVTFIERALPILCVGDDIESKRGTKVDIGGNVESLFFQHGSGQPAPDEAGRGKVCHDGTNGYQEAVLVDIVKLVESPETVVPSLVRFGPVDSVYGRLRHALYFSFTRGFVLCGTIGVNNGKADLFALGLAKDDALSITADVNEMPSEMIEGTSYVVDGLPGEQRDNGDHRLGTGDIMMRECVGKLRVWLDSNFIRIAIQEVADFPFQVLDVLVGPCGSYADERNSFVGSHSKDYQRE